jgi:hypothetical protein
MIEHTGATNQIDVALVDRVFGGLAPTRSLGINVGWVL